MLHFQLVYENAVGDSTELLRGHIHPQAFPRLLLALHGLQAFMPQLHIVLAGHTVTELVVTSGGYTVQGEPIPYRMNEGG
jgi:hypothetical protein